jgi:hypothetical protein
MDSISMCSSTLYLSNMDAGSSLRWLSTSTMTKSHHFDSTSDPEPHNLSQVVWIPVWVWGCYHMPMDSISMCSNTLYMSNVDTGSCLRWLIASTMTKAHHFDYTSVPEPHNLSQAVWIPVWVWGCYHMPMDSILMFSNTLCMPNVDAGSAVWGGYQPQPWQKHIILTTQVSQNPTIWAK